MRIERTLAPGQLERHWDGLAEAINQIGPAKTPVLLAKIALMLAAMLPEPDALLDVIEAALADIAPAAEADTTAAAADGERSR